MSRTSAAAATSREQATSQANIPSPPGFSPPVHMSVSQSHFMDPQRENVTATTKHTGYHISTEVGGKPARISLQYRMHEKKVAETCYIESWISVDSDGGGMTVNPDPKSQMFLMYLRRNI